MKKTTSIIAILTGIALGATSSAHAQATSQPDSTWSASVSAGDQVQARTFTANKTINVFGEDGVVTANQTVGRGLVFDASAKYRPWRHFAVAVGVSSFHGKGNAAAVAAVPDQLLFGTFRTTTFSVSNLRQTDIALNIQAAWIMPITGKIDLALFGGPSLIRVKQGVASVTVDTSTQIATPSIETQKKTTAKAGSAGVDLSYKFTDHYGVGLFVRYLGGEVKLPSAPKLKVGGLQVGVGLNVRF